MTSSGMFFAGRPKEGLPGIFALSFGWDLKMWKCTLSYLETSLMIFGDSWCTNSVWPWLGQIRTSLPVAARMTAVSVVWRRRSTWMEFVVMSDVSLHLWMRLEMLCLSAGSGPQIGLLVLPGMGGTSWTSWTWGWWLHLVHRGWWPWSSCCTSLCHGLAARCGLGLMFLRRASASKQCGRFTNATCCDASQAGVLKLAWLFEGKNCGCTRCACHCHALCHKCRITGSAGHLMWK